MEKKNNKKAGRPAIPLKTQLHLWVVAGGRCQFPGCTKFLLNDKLTLTEGNYANISHIVAWTPTGPRGDKVLSPKLATDKSNLMLTCLVHGRMIDYKKNLETYTVDLLKKFKEEHESRIKTQTSIDVSRKTAALRLQANIRGKLATVSKSDIYTSLITANRYPTDEKGIHVDLTQLYYSTDTSSWTTAIRQIDGILNQAMTIGNDEKKIEHLSVFALAPIPVLAYLGFKLGNTIPADIYIKLRDKPWSIESSVSKLEFNFIKPKPKNKSNTVGLLISITGSVKKDEAVKFIGKDAPIYEIKLDQSKVDQIECVEDLESFRKIYRETIDRIREDHGKKSKIHLFAAIPTSVAVICGRELIHGVDPSILMYEHENDQNGFVYALTIN